ncbi:MAG: tetratricopeptide repeat protein [Acidobacteriota bacterium]|nr:tetratricopeptide repeat protein [Acidobacteriota bacterium]
MKSFACYCQKCRTPNQPGDETCTNCGTPLMLVVLPPSIKHESGWHDYSEEHLLERISHLELRLMQVTDRLSKVLDLMFRQSQTLQREHLLVETLVEALEAAKIIEGGQVSQIWQERQKDEEKRFAATEQRERARDNALAKTGGTKLDLFTHLVKEGFQLIERGEEASGLRTLERAANMSPENFPLLSFIGEHYFRADKRREAGEYLEKAFLLEPKDAKIALLLGLILAEEGENIRAKALLESCCEQFGFAANFPLGMIYAAESDFQNAIAAFKNAQKTNSSAESFYLVGSAFAETGEAKNALKNLQKAVETDPNFADAWFMLGAVYLQLDDEKTARESFARALSAKDTGAQCRAFLKNPKKNVDASINLLFSRDGLSNKNLIRGTSPRIVKILRDEIERILMEIK